uniref:Uncharacterized mitochondrial protein AtMg00810-like n=1 Tax=Tanacetum cinerariifolium TaxID=118510 RepID=A0A6L2P299_TANCI|nr:uncharacterized mitochondrial protein AtMg00810-like [Tanacetum cinerariifolium]
METMNVTFDELFAMAFEQSSSKPRLQSMTSRQISSGLDLSYAPSTITTQQPTEDSALTPKNSSSQATSIPSTSHNVDELERQQQQNVYHQPTTIADNVPNAMFDENTCVNPFATLSTSAAESSSSQILPPVAKMEAIRIFLAQAAHNSFTMFQMDVKTAFLHDSPGPFGQLVHFKLIWGTVNMGIWYTNDFGFEPIGFLDVDYAGCKDTFKSTSSEAQFLGEKLVSWSSKKQDCMALSTAKAEYVSLSA